MEFNTSFSNTFCFIFTNVDGTFNKPLNEKLLTNLFPKPKRKYVMRYNGAKVFLWEITFNIETPPEP